MLSFASLAPKSMQFVFSQKKIVPTLYSFYEKYYENNEDEYKNIVDIRDEYSISSGACQGFSILFLLCFANTAKNMDFTHAINLESYHHLKSNHRNYDLPLLKFTLDTIKNWDGKKELKEKEKDLFYFFITQVAIFQNRARMYLDHLHSTLYKAMDYGFCATQEQLQKILEKTLKSEYFYLIESCIHQMAIASIGNHYVFFDANRGWVPVYSIRQLAEEIFNSEEGFYHPIFSSPFYLQIYTQKILQEEKFVDPIELYSELNLEDNIYECYAGNFGATHMAAKCRDSRSLEYFIKKGSNVDRKAKSIVFEDNQALFSGYTPLRIAVSGNNIDIIKLLLKQKPNVDVPEEDSGFTSLGFSVSSNIESYVTLLLEHHADPNILCGKEDLESPLYIAVQNNYISCVKALLAYSADVNFSVEGRTCFWIAAENNFLNVLKLLIGHCKKHKISFDIDSKCKETGKTALMIAISNHLKQVSLELIQELLEAGADPTIASKSKKTAFTYAEKHCNSSALTKLLLSYKKIRDMNKITSPLLSVSLWQNTSIQISPKNQLGYHYPLMI